LLSCRPVLGRQRLNGMLGFVTFGSFRSGPGYRERWGTFDRAGQLSVQGTGVGRGLNANRLLTPQAAQGRRIMWRTISGANPGAVRVSNRQLGFDTLGRMPRIGQKNGPSSLNPNFECRKIAVAPLDFLAVPRNDGRHVYLVNAITEAFGSAHRR